MGFPQTKVAAPGALAIVLAIALRHAAAIDRRPVYNIAHMVNSIAKLDEAMADGANSVEADVSFADNGTATRLFHGVPCDCFRACDIEEEVPRFLQYVRKTTNGRGSKYSDRLALLFLDLKVSNVEEKQKYRAGVDIGRKLLNDLWKRGMRVNTIREDTTEQCTQCTQTDSDYRGFDISNNDKLDNIRSLYTDLGIQGHRWQGDGISNCLSYLRSPARIQDIIDNRETEEVGRYVEKAYQWTVDLPKQMRRSLRRGVDGIITNKPQRLARIIQEGEFNATLRPANVADSPWTRFGGLAPLPRLPLDDMDILGDDDFAQ
ncbi:hypothetical protein HPB50_020530 [Hyalomma asiaticum]|uniref:Uncharacterized protein n=1 Tax=Hyalomma asiaticum TaxID=266040 RepID=A0ACB7TDB5_HYAAI|nr:hypothetical protein HPB50_020530 [Hyalomma asiaticum]